MSTSGQAAPEPPRFDPQTRDLLQFLREENAANRQAARDEADASRGLLRFTVWLVSIPISLMIVTAAFVGWRSLEDVKRTIRSEADHETKAEIARMQVEIRTTLKDQFQTPALQKTVKDAAIEATKASAEPLIKSEVAAQVRSRVDAERPSINAAVTQQTQSAVRQMGPKIDAIVRESVDTKVQTAVEPVSQRLSAMKADADLQRLITRMDNDDAAAFDQLYAIAATTTDPEARTLANAALMSVIEGHDTGLRISNRFTVAHTEEQTFAELINPDPSMRRTALDTLEGNTKLDLPRLLKIGTSDPSLNVRCEAIRAFDGRVKQTFRCLMGSFVAQWWEAHKKEFEPGK
jgi:hypothetical protein